MPLPRLGLWIAPLLVLGATVAGAQAPPPAAVPVAARALARGTVLTAEDVAYAPVPEGHSGEAVDQPLGWVTRRSVAAGEVLRTPTIAPPNVVSAGDVVQLVWTDGGLELRLRGRAMGSAALGERVSVNVDGRRRFEGVAEGRALVRLEAPERDR